MATEKRILVVDDEVVIRELITDILSEEGYLVDIAEDGQTALELLERNENYVLLFTDIMMPGMDGIELIQKARELVPALVPIVMTGYATIETARAAVTVGAYDYVLKPFNLSEIKLAVSNALDRHKLIEENARLHEITDLFIISEKIASIRDEDQLLDFLLETAANRVGAERASLMLVSPDGNSLEVVRSLGLPEEFLGNRVPFDGSIAGWVAEHHRPLLVPDISKQPDVERLGVHTEDPSFISVPLERKAFSVDEPGISGRERSEVIAVLNVSAKGTGKSFAESDLKALNILANHAAAALENVRLIRDLEDAQREVIYTLGEIVETRSRETGKHVKRVAEYCRLLAVKCGLSKSQSEVIRLASPLHDVGKVGIPDAILNKPGKLTAEEFDVIKTHCQIGYDMLRHAKGRVLQAAALIAHQHHEYFDGNGYPIGIAGKDIHVFGRIAGIADVFDALGVERVYKKAWPLEEILEYFRARRGKQFDPELLDIFFNNLDAILAIRDASPEAPKKKDTEAEG